uniref:Uncharacterized protein n=1 Tax=Sinocyclocheilus anshuiensis TaxID=1608454 RepID=A0A671RYU2_9TELE
SPDGKFLACASQDGFLRIFNFDAVELHGTMKSYFGGLLCVCWSPDGKYIVSGGEDDLVTVWLCFLPHSVILKPRLITESYFKHSTDAIKLIWRRSMSINIYLCWTTGL